MKLAYLAWIAVCVLWGTTYLAIRVALDTFPVALLAGLRWIIAGALLAALLPLVGQRLPALRMWRSIAVIGFLMAVVGNGGVVWAQQYVPTGLAAVVVAMVPFWSVIVEAFLPRGERVGPQTFVGLIVGFLGIVVLLWPELTLNGSGGRSFVYGVVALQIACAGWALGTSYLKRNPTNGSPLGSLALQMLLSGVMLIGIGTAVGEWPRLSVTPRTFAAMAYLILAGSVLGYTAYMYALKNLPVSTVSLYAYVNPVIAVVLGSIVLSEPFTPRMVMASLLVFAGVAIVRRRSTKGRSTEFAETTELTISSGRVSTTRNGATELRRPRRAADSSVAAANDRLGSAAALCVEASEKPAADEKRQRLRSGR